MVQSLDYLRRGSSKRLSWTSFRRKRPVVLSSSNLYSDANGTGNTSYYADQRNGINNPTYAANNNIWYSANSNSDSIYQQPSSLNHLRRQVDAKRMNNGQVFIAGSGVLQQNSALSGYIPTVTVITAHQPMGRHRTVVTRPSSENAYEAMRGANDTFEDDGDDRGEVNNAFMYDTVPPINSPLDVNANVLDDDNLQERLDNATNELTYGDIFEPPTSVWECAADIIEFRKLLGSGCLSDVWRARVDGLPGQTNVLQTAVKVLRGKNDNKIFSIRIL